MSDASGASGDADRWHARVLARAADVATAEPGERLWRVRDGHMADAVDEAVAAAGGAGVAVWAHNGHVGVRGAALGARLRERYGPAYYALGLFFGEGAFRARRMWPGPWGPYETAVAGGGEPDRPGGPGHPGGTARGLFEDRGRAAGGPALPRARGVDAADVPDAHARGVRGAVRLPPERDAGGAGEEYDGLAYVPVSTPSRPL